MASTRAGMPTSRSAAALTPLRSDHDLATLTNALQVRQLVHGFRWVQRTVVQGERAAGVAEGQV